MGKSKPVKLKITASEHKAKNYRSAMAAVQPNNTRSAPPDSILINMSATAVASKTIVYRIYLHIYDGGHPYYSCTPRDPARVNLVWSAVENHSLRDGTFLV